MKQPKKIQGEFRAGQLEALTLMIAQAHQIIPRSVKTSHDGQVEGRSLSHPVLLHHRREIKCRSGLDLKSYKPCLPKQLMTNLMLICEPDWQ